MTVLSAGVYVYHVCLVATEDKRVGQNPWNWRYRWLGAIMPILGSRHRPFLAAIMQSHFSCLQPSLLM